MSFISLQKQRIDRTAKTLRTKTEKLERLCRALQGERNQLREEIKRVSSKSEGNSYTCSPDISVVSMAVCIFGVH